PIEQADDGGVDVPHLVGSRRSDANLQRGRVHTEPWSAPAELPYLAVPRRGGSRHRAESLRKNGERAGRDVPVLERGHHVRSPGPRAASGAGATCGDRTTDRQVYRRAVPAPTHGTDSGISARTRRRLRTGTNARARSTARRILILSHPSGRRSCGNVTFELR